MAGQRDDRYRRQIAAAIRYNIFNPFAQTTRLANTPQHTRPFSQVNLPRHWHIPASGNSMALRGNHRHIIPDDEDEDMGTAVALVQGGDLSGPPTNQANLRSGGPEVARKGTQETAITPQRPHYGLPETVTQVIPSIFYFSMLAGPSKDLTTRVQFRLTSMSDQMITNIATPTPTANYDQGVYNKLLPNKNVYAWENPITTTFPSTGSPDQSQWRDYFHQMYQYYRVLGIEYEFTIQNPQFNTGNDIVVGTFIDTYSADNALNIHNVTNATTVNEIEMWPDVRWKVIKSSIQGDGEANWGTVKGYYKPGMVRQNVENDEDVTTWTKVGSTPSLTEILTLFIAKSAFSTTNLAHGVNIRCKLRKIVQYKDIRVEWRWPQSNQTDIIMSIPELILPDTA